MPLISCPLASVKLRKTFIRSFIGLWMHRGSILCVCVALPICNPNFSNAVRVFGNIQKIDVLRKARIHLITNVAEKCFRNLHCHSSIDRIPQISGHLLSGNFESPRLFRRRGLEVRRADFPEGGPAFEPPNRGTLPYPLPPTFPRPKPAWSVNT
jgi:uncharacterized protein YunC (DUF1805 family)